jgi:hypothetical protein
MKVLNRSASGTAAQAVVFLFNGMIDFQFHVKYVQLGIIKLYLNHTAQYLGFDHPFNSKIQYQVGSANVQWTSRGSDTPSCSMLGK